MDSNSLIDGYNKISTGQKTILWLKVGMGIIALGIIIFLIWYFVTSFSDIRKFFGGIFKGVGKGIKTTGKKTGEIAKKTGSKIKQATEKTAKDIKETKQKTIKGVKKAGQKTGKGIKKTGKKSKKVGGLFKKKKKKKRKKKKKKEGFNSNSFISNDIIVPKGCYCYGNKCYCKYITTTDVQSKYFFEDNGFNFVPSKNSYQFGKYYIM